MSRKTIFVFGSNLAGRHGKGAAKFALTHHGAVYGIGAGRQGYAYAIPTKDKNLNVLGLDEIESYVTDFLIYASNNMKLRFNITRIGCGLAGYTNEDIAPMFRNATHNCSLPKEWRAS